MAKSVTFAGGGIGIRARLDGEQSLVLSGAKHDGQIYSPTILTDVPLDAAIANEETFGPVVVVKVVDTPEEAIAAANRTMCGLTSSILAGNTYKAFEMAPKILAGIVNVNSPTVNDEIHAPMAEFATVAWVSQDPVAWTISAT